MARKKKGPARTRGAATGRQGVARAPKVPHARAPSSGKRVRSPPLARGQRKATGSRLGGLTTPPPRKKATRRGSTVVGRKHSPKPTPAAKRHKLAVPTRVKLREAVTLLRKHVHGYESDEGYKLKDMETWDSTKRRRLIRRAAKLREITNPPHDTIKATTRKARKNLHRFTGQRIRGAKHYIVHKPGDNFKVRVVKGNVEVRGKFKGGVETRSRFFLFPRRPRYPKELVAMARKLQKEMPPGFYVVLTAAHGDTGEPFERDEIIARLNEYLAAYEVDSEGNPTGFSEALLGFRFMATTLHGAVKQRRQVDQRRLRQKEHNNKVRAEHVKAEREREFRPCTAKLGASRCVKARGHKGKHRTATGKEWPSK